jgi:hypothetical protein
MKNIGASHTMRHQLIHHSIVVEAAILEGLDLVIGLIYIQVIIPPRDRIIVNKPFPESCIPAHSGHQY